MTDEKQTQPAHQLTVTIPHRGWRRSPRSEAVYAKTGLKATVYVVDSSTSSEITSGVSLAVSIVEGQPTPHATIGILDAAPKTLPEKAAQLCWERAQRCAPAGEAPATVCARKGCGRASRFVPNLLIVAKVKPNAPVRGRFTNLVVCAEHKATTTVEDLLSDIGWNMILAKFASQRLVKPHRSLTRVEWEELA